jgi:phosphoadenosine phosphosulfate reductase
MRGLIEDATAEEVLAVAVERHHPNLVLACSFQKEESVLIDMLLRIEPAARVFTIDTGVLFPETYETWRKIEDRYGLHVEVMDATPPNGTPWSASNCCGQRKVDALEQALAGTDAWITGIRREQALTRADAKRVEWSERYGVWKIQPVVDWDAKRVQAYIHVNEIPYNPLHDAGYPSIGCMPCTRPVLVGEDERAGRWSGSDKLECGIHGNTRLVKESND